MNSSLHHLLRFVLVVSAVVETRASLFIDPAGGTLLWSDQAGYDDAVIRGRSLGFEFSFFGNDPVTTIDVSTNGNLNFSGDLDYANERLDQPIARISPLWDDLALVKASGDSVIEKVAPGKYYSVTWKAHENGMPGTRHWFQVALFGAAQRIDGRDFAAGDIVFSYAEIGPTFAKDMATIGIDSGDGAVVPVPGAGADTAFLPRGEAGLLPTGAGGFVLFRPDENGDYLAVVQINHAPQARDDMHYTSGRANPTIDVRANDSDPDGDPLTVEAFTQGIFGTVVVSAAGSLVYKPGPAFAGTDIFTYTVRDPFGLLSTANVRLVSFRGGVGTFDGLIADAPTEDDPEPVPTAEGAGYLRIVLSANGGFSGVLQFGGFSKVVRGSFDALGRFRLNFDRIVDDEPQTVTLDLHLDLSNDASPLTGTITDGTVTSQLAAARSRFTAPALPAPQAGKYTALLFPDEGGSGPVGIGFGRMTVGRVGAAVISGRLGDGKPFSFGGRVKTDGTLPFFLRRSAGRDARAGSLFGMVKFDESQTASDCSAALTWFMPDVGDASGFEAAPRFVGARYFRPGRDERVLPLADGPENATLDLGDGTIVKVLTIGTRNRVTVEAPNPERVTLRTNSASGLFSGAFVDETFDEPPVRKRRPFNGAFLQKGNLGGGLYIDGEAASAPVRVSPAVAE